MRFVPMIHNLTTTEQIFKYHNINYFDWKEGWEVGRLVLNQEYRGQKNLVECLYLAARWLRKNTEVCNMFASCSHKMSRLYRQFGFKTIKEDLMLPDITKKYTAISGNLTRVVETLDILNQKLSPSNLKNDITNNDITNNLTRAFYG
jgi:hypothetical protein